MLIVYFFMQFENQWRCSYCGKFFFSSKNWHRRGMLGHPENIVNICNGCHGNHGKGWKRVEDKSNGPVSWTEYTDHDGMVYAIYNMMMCPATPGAYMKIDKDDQG